MAEVTGAKGELKTAKVKNSGSRERVSAGVRLNPKNPIPLEMENSIGYAVNGARYIPFLDGRDNFFNTILRARLGSTAQNACINTKTNYTLGDGLVVKDDAAKDDQQWNEFVVRANNRRQSLNGVYRSAVESFFGFGNTCIEIVRGTAAGKKFLKVYVRNMLDCRLTWPNANDEVESVVISKLFRKRGILVLSAENCVTIPLYNAGPGIKKQYWYKDTKNDVERTCLWIKNEISGYDHYGLPSFVASLINQLIEYQGSRFNLDNLENNMVLSGMVVLAGNIDNDEAQRIADDVIGEHTGEGKNGRIAVVASEQGINEAEYKSFDTHKDGSYIEMDDKSVEKIMLANEWDSTLAGLQSGKALGKGKGYLKEIYDQKMKTVIKPVHCIMADNFLTPLVEIADDWLGTKWSQYDISIQTSNLFEDVTEATTTVNGINAFVNIVKMVAAGQWQKEAAAKFIATRFGLTEQQALEQLGDTPKTSNKNNNVQP